MGYLKLYVLSRTGKSSRKQLRVRDFSVWPI